MIRLVALIALASVVTTGMQAAVATRGSSSLLATPASAPTEIVASVPVSLMIRNDGPIDDRLLGGETSAAARVDVHHTRLVDGERVMASTVDGVAIPAGKTLILETGRSHLMLVGLGADLVQGATFPLTLAFVRAGNVPVTVRVRRRVDAAGATPIPPVIAGDLTVAFASVPPAPSATPASSHDP